MKKILLATVLAAFASTSVAAADMPMKAPMMAAPVINWSGWYVGGNLGYGWGNNNTNFAFLPSAALFNVNNASFGVHSKGVIGGAQIGYNWQIGTVVTGLEADIQGTGISGSARGQLTLLSTGLPVGSALTDQKISWFGTVRGRLGVNMTPELLFYGTGGLVYGEVKSNGNTIFPTHNEPANLTQTNVGWTVGAGSEWMFARNWSAKLEYLYIDLGKASAFGPESDAPTSGFGTQYTWRNQDHIVRAGVNYHF